MKLFLPLSCALVTLLAVQSLAQNAQSAGVASPTQNTLLDDVDLSNAGTDDSNRIRRSGITGLLNKKLHFIGHLSGSSSGSSSHSSSGHHDEHHDEHHLYGTEHHEYGLPHFEHHDEGKAHKAWDFKKHIIASLLQAVKAITGGVVALKGQVLKIGGHLITWKGKLLVKKGDQISDFGRDFAAKALLTPVHPPVVHHHSPIVYSPPTSFGSSAYASAQASHSSGHASEIYHHHHSGGHHYPSPSYSAPSPSYSAPSGGAAGYPYPPSSAPEYEYGSGYGNKVTRAASHPSTLAQGKSQNAITSDQLHAGLLILKPIQVPKDQKSKYQFAQQALLKQASGININTAGNTGHLNLNNFDLPSQSNYNTPSQSNYNTPSQSNYNTPSQTNYNTPSQTNYNTPSQTNYITPSQSNYNAPTPTASYQQSQSLSYQGPSSYGTQGSSPSSFVKIGSTNNFESDIRNNLNSFAPTPLFDPSEKKLPTESSPFDFLYQKNSKSSQERADNKMSNSDAINGNALSALNAFYQQTEQGKEQNRETRNTADEKLDGETLNKILDALFGKDKRPSDYAVQEGDMDSSASDNVEIADSKVLPPAPIKRRSDDIVYPVFDEDYRT